MDTCVPISAAWINLTCSDACIESDGTKRFVTPANWQTGNCCHVALQRRCNARRRAEGEIERHNQTMVAEGVAGREWQRRRQSNAVAIKPDGGFTRERKVNSWPNVESSAAPCEARHWTQAPEPCTGAHAGMRGTAGLVRARA